MKMTRNEDNKNTKVFAVCGKGGVGKTSISAMLTKILCEDKSSKILAIDADPAIGLATALGIECRKSVDDIRNELIEKLEKGNGSSKQAMIEMLDYELFNALEERENLAFLAIGRPETDGCYCQVNELLKDIIKTIIQNFDYVIIDGEAGVEQINRRVLETVTHLVLVSDASVKGLNVIKTIHKVAGSTVAYDRAVVILNRIHAEDELKKINLPENIELLGWLPEDNAIRTIDMEGESIMDMEASSGLDSLRNIMQKIIY
jgi:CO dehydrogenase maturation factor